MVRIVPGLFNAKGPFSNTNVLSLVELCALTPHFMAKFDNGSWASEKQVVGLK
jgi:hypothetical protein